MSEFKVISSNFNPTRPMTPFSTEFWSLLNESHHAQIAVGYAGTASLMALDKYVKTNSDIQIDLFVGMQFIEGLTQNQIEGLRLLDSTLRSRRQGSVSLSTKVKHHAKLYLFNHRSEFVTDRGIRTAYVGSANLEAIVRDYNATFETGVLLRDSSDILLDHYLKDIYPLGSPLDELELKASRTDELPLNHFDTVQSDDPSFTSLVDGLVPTYSFKLPLKTAPKSNLNIYHGKPRLNRKTGRSLPRPWYEAEIIPGKKITELEGYPRNCNFVVHTDDGWTFPCTTNGDDAKNFRSSDNLSVLGAWIKGRLEAAGVLPVGDRVTDSTLEAYGRNYVGLRYYEEPDIWMLDFKR